VRSRAARAFPVSNPVWELDTGRGDLMGFMGELGALLRTGR
jgi:hypothetical protein